MITVRLFAAAAAAAGESERTLPVTDGVSVGEVVVQLGDGNPDLSRVLTRCSFLRDGVAVRDHRDVLRSGETLDVLPPFAGG